MSYKIAIITDIHGNSSALRAVLEEMDKQKDIQHIYCLGDMVAIGHETNEVLELLFSRNDVSMITGNHDEAILTILNGQEPDSHGGEREHHYWIAARLNEKFIPKLRELPQSLSVEHEGKRLLFVHYHMDKDNKLLPIDKQPTVEKLDELYKDSGYDAVCFGHHHPLHYFKSSQRVYLNPSALGCNHSPIARYAILDIGESIEVYLKETEYDNKQFLKNYFRLDVPDAQLILKIFHGNQHLNLQ